MSSTNLAPERSTFLGRAREVDELTRAIAGGARLVTLTGPPGVGKSRLARHVARAARDAYAGGVYACDLARAESAEELVARAREALGIGGDGSSIEGALAVRGRTLLVLDDADRLVSAVATAVGRWLDAAPGVVLLVTSRERLRVEGESCVELGPLAADDGLALLVARATAARADFAAAADEEPVLREIVARLDGSPLALELAAARLAVMSPRALLDLWGERFELLRTGRRDAVARQSTLTSAIDASWELLSDDEKSALAQASVFAGGFALREGLRVISLATGGAVVDVLSSLVDKSLLSVATAASARDERRFVLGETIRDYAAKKLAATGARDAAIARHAVAYAELAARAPRDAPAAERENLLAAHEHLPASEPAAAAAVVLALAPLLLQRGPLPLLVARVDATLGAASSEARAALFLARGRARRLLGDGDGALADAEASLALAEPAGGAPLAAALVAVGVARHGRGEDREALTAFERGLSIAREASDRDTAAEAERRLAILRADRDDVLAARRSLDASVELTDNLGVLFTQTGPIDAARAACERAIAAQQAAKNRRSEGVITVRLASLLLHAGDAAGALARAQQAHAIHREVADRVFEATSVWVIGLAEHELGRLDAARETLTRALEAAIDARARLVQGYAERALAEIAWDAGDEPAARAHALRAADVLLRADDGANAGLARAEVAAADARRGLVDDAERAFAEARTLAAASARHLAAIGVWEGFLDLRRAETTIAASAARIARELATARLATPEDSRDVRLAARLLRRALGGGSAPAPDDALTMSVAHLGMWFKLAGGEAVDLVRRRAMRQLFWALVEKRVAAAGAPMSLDDMLAAAWPGERILHKAGTARIYTAIRTLRDLGLRDVLVTAGDGYMIAPNVRVEIVRQG